MQAYEPVMSERNWSLKIKETLLLLAYNTHSQQPFI